MKKKTKPTAPQPEPFPRVYETIGLPYIDVRQFEGNQEPTCFNGIVRIQKYRITVEKVEEPVEVIHERLRKLWRESDNYHHYDPIKSAAREWGLELDPSEHGRSRKLRNDP